ncbi:MAG: hypothetical protein IJ689_04355 [Alphaproteobacteria bacterium]|nr:hypothetical protein [Alphaproteobacteria bacterium]
MPPKNFNTSDIPYRDIDFQVDTIPDLNSDTGGYMSGNDNTITINYKRGDKEWNDWSQSDNVLIHEQKHRDNQNSGMFAYAIDPYQAYKLQMHDEISANIASLVALRQRYLETGDISVFLNEENSRFAFYGEAIKKGEINPRSEYKEDFDKDMSLIVNGTKDMWMRGFANTQGYIDECSNNGCYYGENDNTHSQYYDENYQRGLDIAYTIGGVNFYEYMDKDIDIPEAGRKKLDSLLGRYNMDNFSNEELAEKFDIPAFDGSMSLEQYRQVVWHKLAMNEFTSSPPEYYDDKDQYLNTICFDKLLYEDKNTDEMTKNYLSENMKRYEEHFAQVIDNVDYYVLDAAVNSAAKQYEGKEPPKPNDEAYNKALDEVYTLHTNLKGDVNFNGDVCLRNVLCYTYLEEGLPEYADRVQNTSGWERTMQKYLKFVGHSDEEAKDAAHRMANGNKFLGAFVCFVGGPVASGVNKIKGLFSSDDKTIENTPLREFGEKTPKYREWEDKDGSRVSDIQYANLPDMRKDVIKKPVKSYGDQGGDMSSGNSDAEKEKMAKIIRYMNKINGTGKEVDVESSVDAICNKYGDKAYDLLLKAVNEPSNYAAIVGDNSIKTSRAALENLCKIDGEQKQKVMEYSETTAKTVGKSASPAKEPEKKQENVQDFADNMKKGHSRVLEMRQKLNEGHVEQADKTRINNLSKLRFESTHRSHLNTNIQPLTAERMRSLLNRASSDLGL